MSRAVNRTGSRAVVNTAEDRRFHGPEKCGVCARPLEGCAFGTDATYDLTFKWGHFECLNDAHRRIAAGAGRMETA